MLSMQCRKNITVEDNKKRMNIANFINIYTNIYTYIVCDGMTQNKNDSITQYCSMDVLLTKIVV